MMYGKKLKKLSLKYLVKIISGFPPEEQTANDPFDNVLSYEEFQEEAALSLLPGISAYTDNVFKLEFTFCFPSYKPFSDN